MKLAAIEGGGTTWVVGLVDGEKLDSFSDRQVYDTTDNPAQTLAPIKDWLIRNKVDAIGIASFGPIDAKIGSPTYGYITSTPKPGWRNTNVLQLLGIYDELKGIPVLFDTDVNAPAMAEFTLHLANRSNLTSCAYITIGTGVGVGLVANGQTVKGLMHPEAGHIMVRSEAGDSFKGTCPFHGNCIEGMCSTGALATRLGCDRSDLPNIPDDHPVWNTCAYYIAQLCASLVMIASPEKIVIGGGVLKRKSLFPKIRKQLLEILNGYIVSPMLTPKRIEEYVCPSGWGSSAGLVGAAYLAQLAYNQSK